MGDSRADWDTGAGVVIEWQAGHGVGRISSVSFGDEPGSMGIKRRCSLMWDSVTDHVSRQKARSTNPLNRHEITRRAGYLVAANVRAWQRTRYACVHVLAADSDEPWDSWKTDQQSQSTLEAQPRLEENRSKRERLEARKNSHLRPVFEAYRLNRHRQTDT